MPADVYGMWCASVSAMCRGLGYNLLGRLYLASHTALCFRSKLRMQTYDFLRQIPTQTTGFAVWLEEVLSLIMPLEEVGRRPGILINKNTKGWAHPALHFSAKTLALPLPSLRSLCPRKAPFYLRPRSTGISKMEKIENFRF